MLFGDPYGNGEDPIGSREAFIADALRGFPFKGIGVSREKVRFRIFAFRGTVKQEVWENRTNSQSIGNLADVSYSASLKGRETTLKYQPVSDVSKVNADVQKAMRNIELLTGGRADVVITAEDMLTADGQQAETEMYADFVAREILGNEEVVRRLVAKERNIAVRFLEWVRSAVRRMGGGRVNSAEYATLKKAEKLLSAALENAKGGVSLEEVEEGVQRMKALSDMMKEERQEIATPTSQARNDNAEVKKETTEENSVDVDAQSARYLIKQFDADSYDYEQNIKAVANMKSVANLRGDEFVLGESTLINKVVSYYDSISNNAYNKELGDVELTKRGIKDSIAHGIGDKKASAYRAVPKIIEQGRVVDYQKNWKNRGYDTAVIAAPITVANEEYYAVVVVRRTQVNQRFYLHEIDIKKRQAVLTEATTTNSSTQELGGLPINSIFEKLRNVNTSDEKTSKKSSRKSLDVDSAAAKNAERKKKIKAILRKHINRMEITDETKERLRATYGETVAQRIIDTWENTTNRTDDTINAVHM